MSRTRRILAFLRPGRRHDVRDDGFSLIETMVALGILVLVMLSTAGFFVQSLKQSSTQSQQQEGAQLANQQLEYTRDVTTASLLTGRTQAAVNAAIAAPGITDLTQDVTNANNFDPAATGSSTQVVPITMNPTVNNVKYTVTTFIDRCYVTSGSSTTCTPTDTGNGWMYRISINVAWNLGGGLSCPTASKACQLVVSTLRDPGSDPCFNTNTDQVGCSTTQPTITSISPNTVTTGSTTTITLTGTNFQTGATVSIDSGGSTSNVTVVSNGTITFKLTTNNTQAAVGTRTITVTNGDGTIARGTVTVTTQAINVTGVSPASVSAGSTTTMTISGSGFQTGASVVTVDAGTIVGTPTVTANSITLSYTAPTGLAAIGSHSFTVTNPDGASDTGSFNVTPAVVTITSISPSTLNFTATRNFTLTGSGFVNGAQITLDGNAINETWVSSTSMTVALTSDPAVGTRTFAVTNPDGGTASKTFTVTANPISFVTAPDPSSPGTKVFVLTGGTFLTGATVQIDNSSATVTSAVVNSSTQMTVTLSTAPTATTHTFKVTNTDGGTASDTFTMAKSHLSNATSSNNWVHSSTTSKTITLTGTNFTTTGTTTVKVNGSTTGVSAVSMTSTTSGRFTYKFSTAGVYTIQVINPDASVSDIYSVTVT